MSLRRYAKKRDGNEQEVVDALEAIGVRVMRLDRPVDLLCGHKSRGRFRVCLIEVKQPEKKGRKDQPDQIRFIQEWQADNLPVFVVTSVKEALAIFGGEPCEIPTLNERC